MILNFIKIYLNAKEKFCNANKFLQQKKIT